MDIPNQYYHVRKIHHYHHLVDYSGTILNLHVMPVHLEKNLKATIRFFRIRIAQLKKYMIQIR